MLLPSVRADSLLDAAQGSAGRVGTMLDIPSTLLSLAQDQYLNVDDTTTTLSLALPSSIFDNLFSTFDVSDHPTTTILASYFLVTAADMVPFVPCQPLAVALGAKLGFALAFPITAIGQTTAGVLAFSAARKASDAVFADAEAMSVANDKLSPEAMRKLQEFRRLTASEEEGDDAKILLALIGLRLAPFFPFSAGNYLLGGTTSVPLRSFVAATLFGCILSNFISVSMGAAGGAMLFSDNFHFF